MYANHLRLSGILQTFCFFVLLLIWLTGYTQTDAAALRQKMAKIRQSTNWNDPVEAMKAKEEIQRLSQQLAGNLPPVDGKASGEPENTGPAEISVGSVSESEIVSIAGRFYQRSWARLDAVQRSGIDQAFDDAERKGYNPPSVNRLTSTGGVLLQFGNSLDEACVYLTKAVIVSPGDTLSLNNFGAYLRQIDSLKVALKVHLYANQIFSESPVILTQIGCSYFELHDNRKAEDYLKMALELDPGFGEASAALCYLYLENGRWREALQQLFAAVAGNGVSYGNASNSFGTIKNACQNSYSGNSAITGHIYQQDNSGESDDKGDFWGENNLQINPRDMLSSLDPEAGIPDDEKLAQLVPPDYHIEMPVFAISVKLEDWSQGGGYSEFVAAHQVFMKRLTAFNEEFGRMHNAQPSLPPNAVLRDYPNERFAIDCILDYFKAESDKEFKKYVQRVQGLPEQVGWYLQDFFVKRKGYLEDQGVCLKASYESYKGCMLQCDRYKKNPKAYEACSRNCTEMRKYNDSECNRIFCLHDCLAANECNSNMNGIFGQFLHHFAEHRDVQAQLLDDLYAFADQWLVRIKSPYWSEIYMAEITRVAIGIVGSVHTAGLYPFQAPVTSACSNDCSKFIVQPQPPVATVITKEMQGLECPPSGKHKFSVDICDLSFDCESIEFGCTKIIALSAKRNFKKKTTSGFFGLGTKGDAGVLSGSVKAGIEITVNDNMEIEDVGAKASMSLSTGWGPAKVGATSNVSVSIMTGLSGKPSWGISGSAK